jgi:RNA polymerase sigma-70 factor (ECF subfamily)
MGSRQPFDLLVERHSPELLRYLWRLLGGLEEAEDCLQDVYLRAYRAYSRLPANANSRAWLFRIATNTARTAAARAGRRAERVQTLLDELVSEGYSPEQVVERSEWLRSVEQAVERLPNHQRAALILRKFQGLGYAEIGEVLGCSHAAARANTYQAVRRLRAALAEGRRRT